MQDQSAMNNSVENHQGLVKIETFKEPLQEENHKSNEKVVVIEILEEETEENISYFMNHEGQYYYQIHSSFSPESDSVGVNGEEIPVESKQADEDEGEILEIVTNEPEPNIDDVNYIFFVDEYSKPFDVVKIRLLCLMDYKAENGEGEKTEDVYSFTQNNQSGENNGIEHNKKPRQKMRQSGHKGNRTYKCAFCDYISIRRYLLIRHMKSHLDERPHKCGVCEKGFKTPTSLQNHVNVHNGVKPHTCKYCSSSFTTSGELVRHVRYRHTHEKPHKCTECDYAAVELSKLRRHVRCHTGERPYQCSHCTYASPDTFKLKRHLRTHTGEKPYECFNCKMRFTQSNSLKTHQRIHNNSKPTFQCESCPAKLGRKADLRKHLQTMHSSGNPMACKLCGQIFLDKYSYKVHIKSHNREKLYKCEHCSYSSFALRYLKSHALIHADEKPFKCIKCSACFRQKQLLRRHDNLYHNLNYVPKPPKDKIFICLQCERTFAHQGNLNRHLAVHNSDSGDEKRTLVLNIESTVTICS